MSNLKFFYFIYKDLKRFFKRHKYACCLIIVFLLVFLFSKYNVFAVDDFVYNTTLHNHNLTYTISSNGLCNVSGNSNGTTINHDYSFNYFDNNYVYVPLVWENYSARYYAYFKVPKGSTYYARAKASDSYYLTFYCDSPYYYYSGSGSEQSKTGEFNLDHITSMPLCNYYNYNLTELIYSFTVPTLTVQPYILNTQTDLTGLLSSTITIDAGDFDNYPITFSVTQSQQGLNRYYTVYQTVLDSSSPFYNSPIPGSVYYDIPVSAFKNYLVTGSFVNYTINQNQGGEYPYIDTIRTVFTPTLSEETDVDKINNIINNNTSMILSQQQQILSQEQQQTDIINDTNSFLKDNNFNSSDINLPTDNTQDITENGINNIFTQIYNGFTSGEPSDIVIPVPFTGKSFTINSDLTTNILNSTGFGWLKSTIEIFWWYIISTFIIKDISKKMNKIKSGDFENIETNNIKEDML